MLAACAFAPLPAAAQSGGSNPFGPLPPPQQPTPEAPEPQRIEAAEDDDGLGGLSFWLIIGTTGAIFAVIAFLITRDMRRTVGKRKNPKRRLRGTGRPAADAANALVADGRGRHEPGSHKARAKAQKRAKTKAARKQRRKARSR